MAFLPKDLSVLAYANGFTLWHYTTPDTAAQVRVAGYMNAASHMLRLGDMVLANTGTAGTQAAGIFLVSGNSGGTVNLSDLTPVGAADSD
ncbi:hypothetical protein HHL28_17150 [Aerophototrophica crusticola]|uniref:Uncharacterized protein n=1 Tax=Aerophototrophica crusticola TaxID=1709002 RepID=A0A858RAQ1_9PROT|nr:hypothetical protein HHL28_17150 [Rhodospirillaceae bacterium B3]